MFAYTQRVCNGENISETNERLVATVRGITNKEEKMLCLQREATFPVPVGTRAEGAARS